MDGQLTRMPDNQICPFDQASMLYSQSQFLKLMTDEHIKDIKSGRRRIEDFYKALQKLSTADARSLLYIDNNLLGKSLENITHDDDDYKNLLINQLKYWSAPIERYNFLIDYKAKSIVPESYLEWFKNDLRCSLFLMSLIQNVVNNEAYKGRKELTTGTANFLRYHIAVFNHYACSFGYKEMIAEGGDWKVTILRSIKATYLKGRTEDKELKWLDVSNYEQIEWACDYLEKNKYTILKGVFFPETIEEKYELILASLDRLSNIERDDIGTEKNKGYSPRSYALFSIKKASAGQKKYGSKDDTKDDSVKIYKKNQSKLDALVKHNKLTVPKLLNKYIEDMYENISSSDHKNSKENLEHSVHNENQQQNINESLIVDTPVQSSLAKLKT